jgi:NADH-quinone oxidoreductase subunit H
MRAVLAKLAGKGGKGDKAGFVSPSGLLPDQPDRARVRRDGRMLGAGLGPAAAGGGVSGHELDISSSTAAIMVGKSLLLLVCLLVFIAYILLADRKIWAAVQLRRGPNVVGPFGLFQSLRRPAEIRASRSRSFRRAPTRACSCWRRWSPACWRSGLGGHSGGLGWAIADINVGVLYILAISSLGVYGVIMAGWASNSKYPFLGALRSAAQMVSYEVSIGFVIITVLLCVGSLNLTAIVEAQNTSWGMLRLVLAAAVPDVRRLLHLGAGRDEPSALRPARSGIGTRRRLHGRVLLDAVSAVHARRIRGDHDHVRADDDPVPRRLAAAVPDRALHLGAGRDLVRLKVSLVFFMFAMVKAFVPRYRYDQLMRLGWKVFLPLSLALSWSLPSCCRSRDRGPVR